MSLPTNNYRSNTPTGGNHPANAGGTPISTGLAAAAAVSLVAVAAAAMTFDMRAPPLGCNSRKDFLTWKRALIQAISGIELLAACVEAHHRFSVEEYAHEKILKKVMER